jgi:hypothetical protein
MKKFMINVKEPNVIDGKRIFTESSHIVEVEDHETAKDAQKSLRLLPGERVVSIEEYVPPKMKVVR